MAIFIEPKSGKKKILSFQKLEIPVDLLKPKFLVCRMNMRSSLPLSLKKKPHYFIIVQFVL